MNKREKSKVACYWAHLSSKLNYLPHHVYDSDYILHDMTISNY